MKDMHARTQIDRFQEREKETKKEQRQCRGYIEENRMTKSNGNKMSEENMN